MRKNAGEAAALPDTPAGFGERSGEEKKEGKEELGKGGEGRGRSNSKNSGYGLAENDII